MAWSTHAPSYRLWLWPTRMKPEKYRGVRSALGRLGIIKRNWRTSSVYTWIAFGIPRHVEIWSQVGLPYSADTPAS